MDKAAGYALAVAFASMLFVPMARANAATISGIYSDRKGTPLPGHQIHFENRISGDIFLTRTGSDGSFSTDLPPGAYDLRAERGLVLYHDLLVDHGAVNLGRVEDGAPLDVRRPFEREGLAPSMVESAAPATAHLHAANRNASAAPASGTAEQSSTAAAAVAPSAHSSPAPPASAAASPR